MGLSGGETSDDEMNRVVAEELERLLAEPAFLRSPVMCRLLTYLVEHRLTNEGPAPKAYAIATEALGRPDDFDPSVDSYPRVMVGRLRALMERHYVETPWLHRLRIPQGSYEIVLQHRAAPPSRGELGAGDLASQRGEGKPQTGTDGSWPATGDRRKSSENQDADSGVATLDKALVGWKRWLIMALAVSFAALLGGGAALLVNRYAQGADGSWGIGPERFSPRPLVHVSIDEPTGGRADAEGSADAEAMGLQKWHRPLENKLRDGIRRFDMFDVTEAGAGKTGSKTAQPDYVVSGRIEDGGAGALTVIISLRHPARGRTLWSHKIRVGADDKANLTSLDGVISQMAGDYGIMVREQIRNAPADFSAGYPCLAQYNLVRWTRQRENFPLVQECMARTVQLRPQDSQSLSAMSMLEYMQAYRDREQGHLPTYLAKATRWAEKAYDAGPASPQGIFAQTRAHFYNGDCDQMAATARFGRHVNDYDAEMAGQLGLFHVMCGKNEQSREYLNRTIRLGAHQAAQPQLLLAMMAAEIGIADQAQLSLISLANYGSEDAHFLAISAFVLARAGRVAEAREKWNSLLKLAAMDENARAETVLRRFTISDLIVQRVASNLRDAGVVTAHTAK